MRSDEIDQLLKRAADDDASAVNRLMAAHRRRLKQMVAVRIDDRLRQRVDPSDVVQETLLEAAQRLPEYAQQKPVAFYPWLRKMALNRLIDLHRRHLVMQKRSLHREELWTALPNQSAVQLADRLVASSTSPSMHVARREQRERVKAALGTLEPRLREVLVLKYLEDLSTAEASAALEVNERTVRRWHRQAVEQLTFILQS